ncbi:MAG: hypothetical protein L0322_28345, partial [Chloroflexi bacterium]|nr:hypothetical protein [Chloroflexota bacterium]
MSLLLAIPLLFLPAGAVALVFLRPRPWPHTAAGLALLAVLLAGLALPLDLTLSRWPAIAQLPPWTLHLDQTNWGLSLAWLLLVLAVSFALPRVGRVGEPNSAPSPAGLLWLAAAGLVALWAGSPAALLAGWALLALAWVAFLSTATHPPLNLAHWPRPPAFLLLALLLAWLAAGSLPERPAAALATEQWPAQAKGWLFLAAVVQLGAFPLHGWRPLGRPLPAAPAALAHVAPAAGGVLLLAHLAPAAAIAPLYAFLATAFGLLGLFVAAILAWSHADRPEWVAAAVALGQAGLLLLVAAWAGREAVLAEGRVFILATGLLFLAAVQPRPRPLWARAGFLLAVAALAGLPLTAGFTGRAALYTAWLANGRAFLLLLAALVQIPLVAAAFRLAWRDDQPAPAFTLSPPHLVTLSTQLPALALLALPRVGG